MNSRFRRYLEICPHRQHIFYFDNLIVDRMREVFKKEIIGHPRKLEYLVLSK